MTLPEPMLARSGPLPRGDYAYALNGVRASTPRVCGMLSSPRGDKRIHLTPRLQRDWARPLDSLNRACQGVRLTSRVWPDTVILLVSSASNGGGPTACLVAQLEG